MVDADVVMFLVMHVVAVVGCEVKIMAREAYMLCTQPYQKRPKFIVSKTEMVPFPCGQCLNCRINQRRIWLARLKLEECVSDCTAWVTMTYNDENLPTTDYIADSWSRPTLKRSDVDHFLRNLRNRLKKKGRTFRYFLAGEYGDKTRRPHYHAILFNVDGTDYYRHENYIRKYGTISDSADDDFADIYRSWPFGFVKIGNVEKGGVDYCLSYVTKKIAKSEEDDIRLQYVEKEFSSKSRGLGIGAIELIAKNFKDDPEVKWPVRLLKVGKKSTLPLGRFLTTKLHEFSAKETELASNTLRYMVQMAEQYGGSGLLQIPQEIVEKNQARSAKQRFNMQKKKKGGVL